MSRKAIDCREYDVRRLDGRACTLTLSGEEDELLEAAIQHVVAVHGLEDTPELRRQAREGMQDEATVIPA